MSKTTKRVALALVILCLCVGGTALYFRGTGTLQEAAKPAAGGQPSTLMAIAPAPAPAPAMAPAPVPPSPPAAAEPVAASGDHREAATVARSGNDDERAPTSRAPREERRSRRKKALAMAKAVPAAGESHAQAATAEVTAPQNRQGHVAIAVRPKLGAAVQSFDIVKVAASVDGHEVSALDGKSFGPHKDEVEAWNGSIDAGEHVLNIVVEYHGNGHGVFSYFDGYRYTARSSTHFHLNEGAQLQMVVDLIDKGGVNTAFEKRLAIAFGEKP